MTRARLVAAAGMAAASLALAANAGAAEVDDGRMTVEVQSSFLKAHKLSMTVLRQGKFATSRKVQFEIRGTAATVPPYDTNVHETGSPTFRLGRKGVKSTEIRPFTYAIAKSKAALNVGFVRGGERVTVPLLEYPIGSAVGMSADFTQVVGAKTVAKLTSAAAKQLNHRLKTKEFKKGEKIAAVSFAADRVLAVTGGRTTILWNPPFLQRLKECNLEPAVLAPAQAVPDGPAGGFALPLTRGGKLRAATLLGSINGHDGGVKLGPGQNAQELRGFAFQLETFTNVMAIDVPGLGSLRFAKVAGGTRSKTLSATTGTAEISGLGLTLDGPLAQNLLSSCSGLTPEMGTANIAANVE